MEVGGIGVIGGAGGVGPVGQDPTEDQKQFNNDINELYKSLNKNPPDNKNAVKKLRDLCDLLNKKGTSWLTKKEKDILPTLNLLGLEKLTEKGEDYWISPSGINWPAGYPDADQILHALKNFLTK